MNFSLIFNFLILVLCSSLVLAFDDNFTGDCKTIYDLLDNKNENHDTYGYEQLLRSCTVNNEGKVTALKIYTYCLTEEEVNKIISYDTINILEIDTNHSYHSSNIDTIRACGNIQTFPSGISNLTNLKSLNLFGFSNYKNNDIAKIPKSVTELTIGYEKPPQCVIDELNLLTNLEKLTFIDTDLEGLNLAPLKNIKKLNTLYLTHDDHSYIHYKKYFNTTILNYFDNLKSLTLEEYVFNQQIIDELSSYTNLEELILINCGYDPDVTVNAFKNLINLKTLEFNGKFKYCTDDGTIFSGDYCPLTEISDSIFSMENLKKLVINEYNTPYINLIGNLINLEYLEIVECDIKNIPDSINNLKKLKILILDKNYSLSSLPDSICDLNIEVLSYKETNITSDKCPTVISITTKETTTSTKKTTTSKTTTKKTTTKKTSTKKTTTKKTSTKKTSTKKTSTKKTTTKKTTTKKTSTKKTSTKKTTTKKPTTKRRTTKRTTKRTTTNKRTSKRRNYYN
eukprot:jgi/Orpsp1_1/1177578/evm.model.c7180000061993.1